MHFKITTLALLLSVAASQGVFASSLNEESASSNASSAPASLSVELINTEDLQEASSVPASSDVIADLEGVDLDKLVTASASETFNYDTLRDLDLNGHKYAGQRAKTWVEEKVPGGKMITSVTGAIAKVFGKETLTEVVLGGVRKPFSIKPEEYPTTPEGIIGLKTKLIVGIIPGGEKITIITGKAGQVLFKTDTLTEGLLRTAIKFFTKDDQEPKAESSESADQALEAPKAETSEEKNDLSVAAKPADS